MKECQSPIKAFAPPGSFPNTKVLGGFAIDGLESVPENFSVLL
jgi:hypothetical protein